MPSSLCAEKRGKKFAKIEEKGGETNKNLKPLLFREATKMGWPLTNKSIFFWTKALFSKFPKQEITRSNNVFSITHVMSH